MPIETNNLVLYKSERLTDTDDGGGKYSGQVIADGQSNNLFNDVSEMDRTMGRVSMRKIFPAVTTNDTDALMGATVFISENPQDPNVSALLFSTENWTDERLAAQNRVENYLAKGGQTAGIPLDTLWKGMKVIQVAMFKQEVEANVGDTIVLISNEGLSNQQEQYLRITKVETSTAILVVNNQPFEYKMATYDVNNPLDRDFVGLSALQWYNGNKSTTINWTGVLVPIPAPGSLTVSYMSQGKFYTLKDNGNGQLKGSSDSYGAGTINYTTGSWLLTAGALPDVDTPILLLWGSPITTFERANLAVLPAAIEFDLLQAGIAASSVTVSWTLDGVAKTATSNAQGHFTGDATGTINYAAGTGRIVPNKLPQKATVFTINYSYGTALTQTASNVTPSAGQLSFSIGTGAAIQPNSVELSIPVANIEHSLVGVVTLTDVPVNGTTGNLVDRLGTVQGTITYATGAVQVTPVLNQTIYNTSYQSVSYVAG
ncbi:hypothetical protein [Acinetobacter sp. ANC 4173]|uniref:hypothetical protein n=1 Tax=Acinetobacter sp. ANC 4173 TaxID=2529837 RepID=UPI00104048E1|nr:hypothetical protein [Acinetobacter sp. ANC 4173]TCB74158.1 hypothetical protein E0H94_17620 [Acinetobacter sp. ANC 4173]